MAKHAIKLKVPEGVTSLTAAEYQGVLEGRKVFEDDVDAKPKKKKYNNTIVKNEHGEFDSKKEYEVYKELKMLEEQKIISDLKHKVLFDLLPTIRTANKTYRKITYEADFSYMRDGVLKVVDVKAFIKKKNKFLTTAVYRIKKHLMLEKHNIEIIER